MRIFSANCAFDTATYERTNRYETRDVHQYKALYREHEDVLPQGDIPCTPLKTQNWLTDQEMKAEIQLSVPGIHSKEHLHH